MVNSPFWKSAPHMDNNEYSLPLLKARNNLFLNKKKSSHIHWYYINLNVETKKIVKEYPVFFCPYSLNNCLSGFCVEDNNAQS